MEWSLSLELVLQTYVGEPNGFQCFGLLETFVPANISMGVLLFESWKVGVLFIPNCVGSQVCRHAVFPSRAGVFKHCSCQLLQFPYLSLGMAALVVRVDPDKRHALLVFSARLHPLMGFENAVVGVIV
jgi:hypothetical protein